MLTRTDLLYWLRQTDPEVLVDLWKIADHVRESHVGGAVHLRGLVELSNHCRRACTYCGLHVANRELERYRMSAAEIIDCAWEAEQLGYGTVVLQAGEDLKLDRAMITEVVRAIKGETDCAVTLSLGERDLADYQTWREAGADRVLIRFETANPELFAAIHPPLPGRPVVDRIQLLRDLRELGYEIGSGIMIGIPGQTWDMLASDLEMFRELALDMIGCGPFIAHPATTLGQQEAVIRTATGPDQVPNDDQIAYRVIALARLLCPDANIPATTALQTVNAINGRELGLMRGANVVMPNVTPTAYRAMYQIYPDKACIDDNAQQCSACLKGRIASIGRKPGNGIGTSPAYSRRIHEAATS